MSDTYKGFKVLGNSILVKIVNPPKKTSSGLLHIPDNTHIRPPIVKVLAKGDGKRSVTVYKDHYYPGSKRWGKAGHEVGIKGHSLDTAEIELDSYYLTIHPYLKSDEIVVDGEKLHIIKSYEIAAKVELEEGETEEDLSQIQLLQMSV